MGVEAFEGICHGLDRELWVVTARCSERASGMVATYVSKVSLVPALPRVTVAVAKHHFTHELIDGSGAFAMHLLGEEQLEWIWRFGLASGRDVDKLAGMTMMTRGGGAPILKDALAWADCRVEARFDTGDRTIFLAEVLDAWTNGDAEPLTFKRMIQIAPAEKLQALKIDIKSHVELDTVAILEWRDSLQQIQNRG